MDSPWARLYERCGAVYGDDASQIIAARREILTTKTRLFRDRATVFDGQQYLRFMRRWLLVILDIRNRKELSRRHQVEELIAGLSNIIADIPTMDDVSGDEYRIIAAELQIVDE